MDFLNNPSIWSSQLYQFCKDLPKGGDLHLHDMAILPVDELISFCENRKDIYICCNKSSKEWCYVSLMDRIKNDDICLEICPVSNQILEYAKDLRQHPAVAYMRNGIAITLCSDDPAYQSHTALVDDYFAAIVCWDLSIAEVKQLSYNAIYYSGLSEDKKAQAIEDWNKRWDNFVGM